MCTGSTDRLTDASTVMRSTDDVVTNWFIIPSAIAVIIFIETALTSYARSVMPFVLIGLAVCLTVGGCRLGGKQIGLISVSLIIAPAAILIASSMLLVHTF